MMSALKAVILSCIAVSVAIAAPSAPSLPIPAWDVPSDLNPPLAAGRVDYHGWLLLPWVTNNTAPDAPISGWFYHHTPEFFTDSPHDFEVMVAAELYPATPIPGMPLPPAVDRVGTEYVFTPPAFSLDELLTGNLTSFTGKFSNGSFDTPQRIILSQAVLVISNLTTVHYLHQNATSAYTELPYYSYPRDPSQSAASLQGVQHFYLLHLEQHSPDFDQLLHATINLDECQLSPLDTVLDITAAGAIFVVPSSVNDVYHRLVPSSSTVSVPVILMTDATRNTDQHTKCTLQILEEVHCVVMPDSFANCPPPASP